MTDLHMQAAEHSKIGVLLVNLGTPDGPDTWSVRRYLAEFLSDRRVIELPRWLWQPLLHGPVLTVRSSKAAHAYRQIWTREGSPLLVYTKAQAERLAARIGSGSVMVDFAMTYGKPSIASKIAALTEAGCDRIFVLALYPQYSATTTGAVYDRVFAALKTLRKQPALRTAPAFYHRPAYIKALAGSIRTHIEALDFAPDRVVMSYHGIPKAYCDRGDPYDRHCLETSRLVGGALGWDSDFLLTTFQSRFGRTEWLQPYTDKTLAALAGQGATKLVVASPAFFSDCLETLEELAIKGKAQFHAAGGTDYSIVPCLNDSDAAIDVLENTVRRELAGWVE